MLLLSGDAAARIFPYRRSMLAEKSHATRHARALARLLDSAFRVPGTRFRFGLDPLLGLVPGLGDAVGGGLGLYLLVLAYRAGAPPVVMLRMGGNIAADALLGAIPLLGDLFDATYRANLRNLELLDRYLTDPRETTGKSLAVLLARAAVIILVLVAAVWLVAAALRALAAVIT